MIKNKPIFILGSFLALLFASCGSDVPVKEENTNEAGTPVTLTAIAKEPLQEIVELNATSSFTLKSNVKSNTNGYLQNLKIKLGDYVNKGDELFLIKTKEAESLGNTINQVDTSLHFKGIIVIRAPGSGYITALDHQTGDYVQDGDQVQVLGEVDDGELPGHPQRRRSEHQGGAIDEAVANGGGHPWLSLHGEVGYERAVSRGTTRVSQWLAEAR